jgi:hypothetical protein
MRHIRRDQAIWVLASILGMALPCMMSLEFIRNATVTGDWGNPVSGNPVSVHHSCPKR